MPANDIVLKINSTARVHPGKLFAPSSMHLKRGVTTALLGKSGTGKSTLLKLIAGLYKLPDTMEISGLDPAEKRTYMTQEVQLLPWFNVEENTWIGDRLRGQTPNRSDVLSLLKQLELDGHTKKFPHELSGGMAQRVALARTLFEKADLNLLDEPFAALDALTRRTLQNTLKMHFKDKTVLIVTHDPIEAARIADTCYLLRTTEDGLTAELTPFETFGSSIDETYEHLFEALQAP